MIFDTNILIYADRAVVSAKELIMNTPDRSISAVTYIDGLSLKHYLPE